MLLFLKKSVSWFTRRVTSEIDFDFCDQRLIFVFEEVRFLVYKESDLTMYNIQVLIYVHGQINKLFVL